MSSAESGKGHHKYLLVARRMDVCAAVTESHLRGLNWVVLLSSPLQFLHSNQFAHFVTAGRVCNASVLKNLLRKKIISKY
jgi:hypothetical protein